MKRNAAIAMALFYLTLTSGMFACFVSCGTSHLVEFFASVNPLEHVDEEGCHEKSEKDCKGDVDCSCCKKHGEYSVKENVKPSCDTHQPYSPIIAENINSTLYYLDNNHSETLPLPRNQAPPPGTSVPIFIQIHSLLI